MLSRRVDPLRTRRLIAMAVGLASVATLVSLGPSSRAFAEDAAPDPSLPSVTITSPASGAMVPWNTPLTIETDTAPGTDGWPVVEVRFTQSLQPLSSDMTAPYQKVVGAKWTGPAVFTAVAVDDHGNKSSPATVEIVTDPGPGVVITQPRTDVLPVDEVAKSIRWSASIVDAVNSGRSADDPRIWLDRAEVFVDGELAETITADDACTADCPAPGRPTAIARNFTWNPAAKGRGLYSVSVVATDSAGFATTAVWNYRVVNRPRLTLRDTHGAVVPPTIRVPTGAPVTFVADIASDEPDTVIRSVVVYNDGGRYADGVEPCAAPPYCPTPIVVRKVWGGPAGKAGTVDDLRIVVEDQWGIQTEVAVHVEVYAATYMLANSECCSVNLGKSVQLSGQLLGVEDYKGEPGRRVTVQWRPVGSTSWQTLATPTTSSTGRFSGIRHTPHRNGTYRFTYAGVPDILGGSTASVPAEVYPRVKGKFRHGGWIHRGHIARLDVHTTPAEPSSVWRLQRLNRHDHMVTVIKRRIPASRHTTFKMRLHRRGWHTYQVVRPATAAYGFSYSKVFVVYVK